MKKRLDRLLVDLGLARSRTQAQDLIHEGKVFLREQCLTKPSLELSSQELSSSDFRIEQGLSNRFVSRGGLKLEAALKHFGLKVQGTVCLDVGISTGGFTDCLLREGAEKVVGVDVGHNQLSEVLKKNPKVHLIEGLNARDLTCQSLGDHFPMQGFNLIVADLSFISLGTVLPRFPQLLSKDGQLLCLVKPQFEVGPQGLDHRGIVSDPLEFSRVQKKIEDWAGDLALVVRGYWESSLRGRDGNTEFFLWASMG